MQVAAETYEKEGVNAYKVEFLFQSAAELLHLAAIYLPSDANRLNERAAVLLQNGSMVLKKQADALRGAHLHYYLAVKGGKSGTAPTDPLSVVMIPRTIYLTWPYQLPGDVIPTFTVNMVFSPPAPGAPWQGNTFYPAGSVIISSTNNGHYYTALTGGISGTEPHEPDLPVDVPPTTEDGDLIWLDSGATAPNVSAASSQSSGGQGGGGQGGGGQGGGQGQGAGGGAGSGTAGKPQQWLERSHYLLGDVILDPYNGHYFTMVRSKGGTSGKPPANTNSSGQNNANSAAAADDPFPTSPPSAIRDGNLLWLSFGPGGPLPAWHAGNYSIGDGFTSNGTLYRMVGFTQGRGTSRVDPFTEFRFEDGDLVWSICGAKPDMDPTCNDPGVSWTAGTDYNWRDVVRGSDNYLYYVSSIRNNLVKGKSGTNDPFMGGQRTIMDGALTWSPCGDRWGAAANPCARLTETTWKIDTPYDRNVKVKAANKNFYYVSSIAGGGRSELTLTFPPPPTQSRDCALRDGDVCWLDSRQSGPGPAWKSGQPYSLGDSVAANNHVYIVVGTAAGSSGDTAPIISSLPGEPTTVTDGDLVWMFIGKSTNKASSKWLANTHYELGDVVKSGTDYYEVIRFVAGTSGPHPVNPFPAFPAIDGSTPSSFPNSVIDGTITWKSAKSGDPSHVWDLHHTYAKDWVVTDGSGHYWQAIDTGRSGEVPVQPPFQIMQPSTVVDTAFSICDGGVTWSDLGTARPPADLARNAWEAQKPYKTGDIVHDMKGRYYSASTGGNSGKVSPVSMPGSTGQACDSNLMWSDLGVIRPSGLLGQPSTWTSRDYSAGEVVFVPGPGNGRYYAAALTLGTEEKVGKAGGASPFLSISPTFPIIWQNSGATVPASVASGQPADQSVGLVNLTLPQTHSLSYFNLAAGAVVGLTRYPNFGFVPAAYVPPRQLPPGFVAATPGATTMDTLSANQYTGCTVDASKMVVYSCPGPTGYASRIVDPVLVLTVYPIPIDAEVPWTLFSRQGRSRFRDLIPGVSVGFSLTSPSSNFYIGGSIEAFIRNVQIFGGLAIQNGATSVLTNANQVTWSGTGVIPTVQTTTGYRKSPFMGLTYNLSGFIQSLFSPPSSKSQ